MKIKVWRDIMTDKSTMGRMYVDDQFEAYTLELPIKDGLPGSAIPPGTYKITTYPSPHFGRLMPLLEDIPGRSEIEIHWGNEPDETRGCILIGKTQDANFIGDSRAAFDDFWAKAQGPIEAGDCEITIEQSRYVDLSAGDL